MSGGIDSTACAQYFLERQDNVVGVFIDYGQAARKPEHDAVQAVAKHLEIPLHTLVFKTTERFGPGEIVGRNAFLIFAALMSENPNQGILSLGIHHGTSYYDCGNDFLSRVNHIIESYSSGKVVLDCPFASVDKSFVYRYAESVGAPLHLTYSCELGTVPPCGQCLSCRDRYALSTS